MSDKGHFLKRIEAERNFEKAKHRLRAVAQTLEGCLSDIDKTTRIKYTDWFVIVKRLPGGKFEPVKCVDSNDESAEFDADDGDLILPIPDFKTLAEFEGF